MPSTPARRVYNRRVFWLALAYGAALLAATYAFEHNLVTGPLAFAVALLPAMAIVGIFAAIGRYLVEEQDEYVRLLMVRQTLVASAFALSIATFWGFLEGFELVPHAPAFWVAAIWYVGLGLGALVNKAGARA